MKIKIGLLRKIIREEVQRLSEETSGSPLGRFDKSLVDRVIRKTEELLANIRSAASNDDHDDAETIFFALYEIMDTVHYAYSAIRNIPKQHMDRLVKNYRYFDDASVKGAVNQLTENMILQGVSRALDLLKDDVARMADVDSCGRALADFSDDILGSLKNLQRSNQRASSLPPPRSR